MAAPTTCVAKPQVRSLVRTLTMTEINASGGTTLINGSPERTITVIDFWTKAVGATVRGLTTFDLKDNFSTPVVVGTCAQANLTTGVLRAGASGTVTTNLGLPLTAGCSLMASKTGGTAATATGLIVGIKYFNSI